MTTAEALDAIPEIVAKAIPINFDYVTCPTKRANLVQNAEWRREQLAGEITGLIIRHEAQGIGIEINLDELIRRSEQN